MDLFKVNINFDSTIKDFLTPASREELALELGNEYSVLARQAAQAKVPVRTQELRNSIRRDVTASDSGAKCTIYIAAGIHQNSPFPYIKNKPLKRKPRLEEVAEDLNNYEFTRSQSSISDIGLFSPIPGGSTTANWIEDAIEAFEAAI